MKHYTIGLIVGLIVTSGLMFGLNTSAKESFPDSIKVGGLVYKIEMVKDLDNAMGLTDFNTQTISIEANTTKQMQELTLMHEIIHCINSEEVDERVVDMQAQGLYQVIKDNNLFK